MKSSKPFITIIILVGLVVLIKLLALNPDWVERFYTYGIYPAISKILRALFGWLPFSVGDLFYFAVALYLIIRIIRFIRFRRRKEPGTYQVRSLFLKFITYLLAVYVWFNLAWGLNYDRRGIAGQLGLHVQPYTTTDLIQLTQQLQNRLNASAYGIDTLERVKLEKNAVLFEQGTLAYRQVFNTYPFLRYVNQSIKPSMFSHIGQYFGFTGYYNPFSGEAQLKTTVPVFLKPFIVTHEMAHQLGYAKENEANFVGYLACRRDTNLNFQYSVYLDLTLYALSELKERDSAAVKILKQHWNIRVIRDYKSYIDYLNKSENPIEPWIMKFYSGFLKMNNQPGGTHTYNEVIATLIAYMKKFGTAAI